MDVKEIFRNLVTGQYMPYFAYCSHKFSFQTVFNNPKLGKARLRYCYCLCGIEHECLEYITGTGEVNEKIYNNVVQSVVDGKCPHVDHVPKEYVGKAVIFGIHLAAAVGTVEALTDPKNQFPVHGNIFEMDPYQTAVFKGNFEIVSRPFMKKFSSNNDFLINSYTLPYLHRDKADSSCIRIERIPMLNYCIRKGNINLLKSFLKLTDWNSINFVDALQTTFECGFKVVEDILIQKIESSKVVCTPLLSEGIEVAVVYNRPIILDKLLILYLHCSNCDRSTDHYTKDRLRAICFVLERKTCANILKKRINISLQKKMKESEKINTLFQLLNKYDFLKEEIIGILKSNPMIPDVLMSMESFEGSSKLYFYFNRLNAVMAKISLDIVGVNSTTYMNINMTNLEGRSMFIYLLSEDLRCRVRQSVRQPAELFIYDNPDLQEHENGVRLALEYDVELMKGYLSYNTSNDMGRYFVMDSQEHGWFGHDSDDHIALNFLAPLLVASGFPISGDVATLLEQNKTDLHPQEYAYIRNFLQTPKSLQMTCRDCLRKTYQGHSIHQFVQAVNIPQRIRDMILLKFLLKVVPSEYLELNLSDTL